VAVVVERLVEVAEEQVVLGQLQDFLWLEVRLLP
jgi:hypothetical protein